MAASAGYRNPTCHTLNFFYDDEDGCALTVMVNEIRFHIIADANRLRGESGPDGRLAWEYRGLVRKVRDLEEKECDPDEYQKRKDLEAAKKQKEDDSDDEASLDSGVGHSCHEEADEDNNATIADDDSGVDVETSSNHTSSKKKELSSTTSIHIDTNDTEEIKDQLRKWMLTPFGTIFTEIAPASETSKKQTVHDWYNCKTYFYTLEIADGELRATQETEELESFDQRMKDLLPRLTLPKYIRNLDIPWHNSKDVIVLDANDQLDPYHPTRVSVRDSTYFMKLVAPEQPQATKREIRVLKEIEKAGLHKQFLVPQVLGLVGVENSKTDAVGFLLTEIESPTPLTHMLDEDIPQRKRDKWAKEVDRIKGMLHRHDIIFGDAKADNFIVDKNDDLWIIDFGGSYTEGWIDPELVETKEGDDMGVERIVNALHDPVANTFDPTESEQKAEQKQDNQQSPRKRKANDVYLDEANDGDERPRSLSSSKRQKT